MLKRLAIFSAAVAVCTMVALAYVTARFVDKDEILRAQNELHAVKQQRLELEKKVGVLSEQQAALKAEVQVKATEIAENKKMIARLEQARENDQLKVRQLRTANDLERKFMETYPAVAKADNVGIAQLPNKKGTLTLDYMVVPAWFSETFIIEHEAKQVLEEELVQFRANEKLYGNVIELSRRVLSLEEEKTAAYQQGYEVAYARYEDINERYIGLLKEPPKVEFKAPNKWVMLGCSVLGVAVGASL